MPATATPPARLEQREAVRLRPSTGGGGRFPPPLEPRGWGGGDFGGDGYRSEERYKLAVWIGIGGIIMFFASITSAMIVRRAGEDWRSIDLPYALWYSTAALLASSLTFELARRQLRRGTVAALRIWTTATAALGVAFLCAQYAGWLDLLGQGIAVNGRISGSFFYLFTAAHGAHVVGGLVVLAYITVRVWRTKIWPTRKPAIEAAAIYWHFMDVLWLVILGLLAGLG